MLCPYALELLLHGSTPQSMPSYPTADEAKSAHDRMVSIVSLAMNDIIKSISGIRLVSAEREYLHTIGIRVGDILLCANSKADLVYTLDVGGTLVTVYVEVSTRLHVAKPWQTLLRGIALYYERRLPVWIVLVSPEEVRYKLVSDEDQDNVVRRVKGSPRDFQPSPNLCSLCELLHYCPYRVV